MNSSIVWAGVPKQCEIEGKVSQVASKQASKQAIRQHGGVCSSLLLTVDVVSLHSVAYIAMDCDLES